MTTPFVAPFFSKITSSFTEDTTTNVHRVFGLNVLHERNNERFHMKQVLHVDRQYFHLKNSPKNETTIGKR